MKYYVLKKVKYTVDNIVVDWYVMRDLAIDNNIINCIFHLFKYIVLHPEDGSDRKSRNT
jgi:hypothetical protein